MVSVIDTIVGTNHISDNLESCLKKQRGDCNLKGADSSFTENDYIRVRCDKLSMDENTLVCANSNNDVRSTMNQSLENDIMDGTEHDSEHTLYEESDGIDAGSKKSIDTSSFSIPDVNINRQSNTVSTIDEVNEVQTRYIRSNRDEAYCNSHDLKPILYEQCCDFSDVNEHDQISSTTTQSSQPCLLQVESDLEHRSCENNVDVSPSKVGKCIKVYTHKRRKSVDDIRSKLVHTQCNLVPTPPPSTDSIDLLDEPSANDVPVTLLTSLDMESAEYILSLSAESIQSIVGGTISDQHTVIGCRGLNTVRDAGEQSDSTMNADVKPVLRRSTRLNQQENDEAANNDLSIGSVTINEKSFRKSNSPNRTESCVKVRRKGGREDRKVPDHTTVDSVLQTGNKKSFKNKRSNSKLIVRKSNKSTCAVANSKEEEESKPKVANSRLAEKYGKKAENTEKWVTSDRSAVLSTKSDAISGINRVLWGDMSDVLDGREESEINLLAYPGNTEIPFAVGLLPLRTALEKMQATPDYQPRKTRSSVAPMKQDVAGGLKRRLNFTPSAFVVPSKKHNCNTNNGNPKTTVCHIQIKTAPSQDVKSRKRFLSNSIASLSETNVADRQ